jgi:hypothetical protein
MLILSCKLAQLESESYITIDGQSASLSWNKAPIWGLRPDFYYYQAIAAVFIWGFLSDERTGLSFKIAAGLASKVIFRSEFRGTRDYILLSQIWDFPFRRLLLFAGLRWGVRPRLHTVNYSTFYLSNLATNRLSLYSRGTDHIEINFFYLRCVFAAPLPSTRHGANLIERPFCCQNCCAT